MAIDSSLYQHEEDLAALKALEAIPGFTQVMKTFMKVWNEKQFRILNMSSNLRLSEKQMPKYYAMLPPICEKLGIDVPELYLSLDVVPNSYTYGDNQPFIVLTSGLLEMVPEELIPTVLAHECGHIACHHTLYRTMGIMLLNGAASLLGIGEFALMPLQVAFYHWLRCSEYSADRAAAVYEGSADKVVDLCMRLAGYDKDIDDHANVEAFIEQAIEYKTMVKESKWNETLEYMIFEQSEHPMNAVRAYECNAWQKTEQFANIQMYLEDTSKIGAISLRNIPMRKASKQYVGCHYSEVQSQLYQAGFRNIDLMRMTDNLFKAKSGNVVDVVINGNAQFSKGDWYPADAQVKIIYYEPLSDAEIAASHPGEVCMPRASREYLGRDYRHVMTELREAGFQAVYSKEKKEGKKGWFDKDDSVALVDIGGKTMFEKGEWFDANDRVMITYRRYEDDDAKK